MGESADFLEWGEAEEPRDKGGAGGSESGVEITDAAVVRAGELILLEEAEGDAAAELVEAHILTHGGGVLHELHRAHNDTAQGFLSAAEEANIIPSGEGRTGAQHAAGVVRKAAQIARAHIPLRQVVRENGREVAQAFVALAGDAAPLRPGVDSQAVEVIQAAEGGHDPCCEGDEDAEGDNVFHTQAILP